MWRGAADGEREQGCVCKPVDGAAHEAWKKGGMRWAGGGEDARINDEVKMPCSTDRAGDTLKGGVVANVVDILHGAMTA